MTKRQAEVLKFIRDFINDNGYSPSFDEIKDGCRMRSKSHAFNIVRALERHGEVVRRPHLARGITVPSTPLPAPRRPDMNMESLERRWDETMKRFLG